ncbi:MAG: Molybdopterin dehydrogenase, FAD-binding [Chloroflexi bacterium]|nr:Molybdopterin dehydrogenase, FAD-binding [Chloroflexota bacterium]
MLSPFRVLHPTTIEEASSELARLGDQAVIYAGGAELVLLIRNGLIQPDYLVNIKRIPGLDGISSNNGEVRIGTAVTHRRLETDPVIHARLPALAEAESHVGNIRVRSQGTLGGNLCFADPHADPGTALLVYDASVEIGGANGGRQLPLAEFLVGTYETALQPGELLTEVRVPPLADGWRAAFLRIERFYRPTANVAAALSVREGKVDAVRLAVGCVGPKAMRLTELEGQLHGASLQEADRMLRDSKPYLTEKLEPVSDLLGSAGYKITITSVLLARALEQAAQGNGGAH